MAFYRKNIRNLEQGLRVVIGLAAAILAIVYLSGWSAWLIAATGVMIALTGLIGYCPMCAAVGIDRRKDI
jgi:hypothetical protein